MIPRICRLLVIPLVAELCCSGCTTWVPIEPSSFPSQENTRLDTVRIGGEDGEVVERVSIAWPLLTGVQRKPVTINLALLPNARPQMKPRDADAIAQGQTREFDELSLGGVVFFDATIKSPGPVLTAFKRYPVTLDLERTRVYWERPNAGATTGAVFGVILGVAAAAAGIGALVYLISHYNPIQPN